MVSSNQTGEWNRPTNLGCTNSNLFPKNSSAFLVIKLPQENHYGPLKKLDVTWECITRFCSDRWDSEDSESSKRYSCPQPKQASMTFCEDCPLMMIYKRIGRTLHPNQLCIWIGMLFPIFQIRHIEQMWLSRICH